MTKERLQLLIELAYDYGMNQQCYSDVDKFAELQSLRAEFEAWEPDVIEKERDDYREQAQRCRRVLLGYTNWLRDPTNRPQEVAIDDD